MSRRLLLLTYRDVLEITVLKPPVITSAWSVDSHRLIHVDVLNQQESITYDENGDGFYYTTEASFPALTMATAPIRKAEPVTCSPAIVGHAP